MALGVVWLVAVLAGPPVAHRAVEAVATEVAKKLQIGVSEPPQAQEVDRKRWLTGVVKRMLAELTVAGERLEEARARGYYWQADVYSLAFDEWTASHKAVSDEPELARHYMVIRLAFEELHRINTIVSARWNHHVVPSKNVDPSDRLPDAIGRVEEGIERLTQVGDVL